MKRLLLVALAICLAPITANAAAKSPAAKIAAAFRASHPAYSMAARNVTAVPNSHLIAGIPSKMKPGTLTNNKSGRFTALAVGDAPKGLQGTRKDVKGSYRLVGTKAVLSNVTIKTANLQMAGMPKQH